MPIATSLVLVLMLAAGCAAPTAPSGNPRPLPDSFFPLRGLRVLMLTATAGFRHDSIAAARQTMSELGTSQGFSLFATEDLTSLNPDELGNFDVVMFALTSGELRLSEQQRRALIDFVAGGKGFVGTHSATDTLREWPEYGRLVGSYVIDHPWTQPARVLVEDSSHPATGIRDAFALEEEYYVFGDNPRVRVQVLLRLDPASVGATGDYPLAWAQSFGSGRSYYNALGHFSNTWRDARYQQQLIAGIRWASGK
jgi:type 1 glutamine amidotransferase